MLRRVILSSFLIIAFFGLAILTFKTQGVKASGVIYIRADGSIDPPTANITSIDGNTYILTSNIYEGIVIQRSNITIDGTGHVIQGCQGGVGIYFESLSGVKIINLTIRNFEYSTKIYRSSDNAIIKCNMTNKMSMYGGSRYNITQCKLESGLYISHTGHSKICSNYVENGILLDGTDYNYIQGNRIAYGNYGIKVIGSAINNTLRENQLFHCQNGIIFRPQIPPPMHAPNTPKNNFIIDNEIISCEIYGISLNPALYTNIYHNNFINNTQQAYIAEDSKTYWDNEYPSGGNYWSDYDGVDADGDGIGDDPYLIDSSNVDNFPLTTRHNASHWSKLKFNPVAKLDATSGSARARVEFAFDASSSISGWDGSQITKIEMYNWTFGDGSTTSTSIPNTNHTYMSSGAFNVTVKVIDNSGMAGQDLERIFVSMPTTITVSATPASTSLGLAIKISGTLKDFYERDLQSQTVVCYYKSPGINWIPIISDHTDQNGLYELEWIPPATGCYTIMVEFQGEFMKFGIDSVILHFRSENYVTIDVLNSENRYLFLVETNSSISELLFNSTTNELSFNVSGPDGSYGYSKVTSAKDSFQGTLDMHVYIDGEPTDHMLTSSDDYWEITFHYLHSTHSIMITLCPVQAHFFETLLGRALILVTFTVTVVIIILLIARRKTGYGLHTQRPICNTTDATAYAHAKI